MKTLTALASIAFTLFFSTQAKSTTINFEDSVSTGQSQGYTSYLESGYKLTSQVAGTISPTYSSSALHGPTTGSDFYSAALGPYSLIIARVDGGAFSLQSFDAGLGAMHGYLGDTYRIQGVKQDSSTFETNFFVSADTLWHSISFAGNENFNNLKSITISPYAAGTSSFFAIDNISVSEVPIPATGWLLGTSLAGIGAIRKRKSN